MEFSLKQIGVFKCGEDVFSIEIYPEYRQALQGLEGFEHIQVLWWFDKCDDASSRGKLVEQSPYKKGPQTLGTFATRSPERPNPIALSCARVTYIDRDDGFICLCYADAEDGSPVLDIKPYTPSLDRVANPRVPDWCAHWPKCTEDSGDFDWENEFNF